MQKIIFRIYCKRKLTDFNFPHHIVWQLVALLATFLKAHLNKDVSKRQQTRVQDVLIWIRKATFLWRLWCQWKSFSCQSQFYIVTRRVVSFLRYWKLASAVARIRKWILIPITCFFSYRDDAKRNTFLTHLLWRKVWYRPVQYEYSGVAGFFLGGGGGSGGVKLGMFTLNSISTRV